MSVAEGCRAVLARAAAAAARAGRDPAEVTVVAAAKGVAPAGVVEALAAGIRDVGESYVQEARARRDALGASGARWHFIGRLQRNKANAAVRLFDLIHSIDSLALARAVDRAGERAGRRVRCLLEVNLGGEVSKGGVAPEDAAELCTAISRLPAISLEGLMTMPPPGDSAEGSRAFFARLHRLRDDLARLRLPGVHLKELSMGMSGDFEVAIEEGATLVRVGTAIFGERRR